MSEKGIGEKNTAIVTPQLGSVNITSQTQLIEFENANLDSVSDNQAEEDD